MTAIHNKHVLVTGGASGIGRLLVLGCAKLGATVTIWDLDAAGAENVALEAAELGASRARAFVCDVSDREQVYARANEVRAAAGDVDVLVNNAGIVSGRPLLELPDERIEKTFGVNTLALFWTDQGVPAADDGPRQRPRRHRGLGRRPHRYRPRDRLRGQQVRRRWVQRGAAAGVAAQRLRRPHDRRLPVLHRHGHVQGREDAVPLLLPVLKEQDVADRVLKAIQHDHPVVQMPFMVNTLPAMRLLPVWAFDQLTDLFGLNNAMDAFTGRAPADDA